MTTAQQKQIADILDNDPKELLNWDPSVLQYHANVRQWFDLVGKQEYEVLAHVLQHNGEWLNLVRKVVAHGAVVHQDTFLISAVPHLRPDIEQMLANAKEPFRPEFLDAVQDCFMEQNPRLGISDVLREALLARGQQKRLQQEVELQTLERSAFGIRKL